MVLAEFNGVYIYVYVYMSIFNPFLLNKNVNLLVTLHMLHLLEIWMDVEDSVSPFGPYNAIQWGCYMGLHSVPRPYRTEQAIED